MTQDHLTSLLKLPSNADELCVDLILEMVVEVGGNARSVTQFECPECSPPVALCKAEGGACFSRWHHVITLVNRMLLISLGTLIKGKTTLMHERNFPRFHSLDICLKAQYIARSGCVFPAFYHLCCLGHMESTS